MFPFCHMMNWHGGVYATLYRELTLLLCFSELWFQSAGGLIICRLLCQLLHLSTVYLECMLVYILKCKQKLVVCNYNAQYIQNFAFSLCCFS